MEHNTAQHIAIWIDNPPDIDDARTRSPPSPIKVTLYRLLNTTLISAFGFSKAVLAYKGESISPTTLELVMGVMLGNTLWWLGYCESAKPPIWSWFFHDDYSFPALQAFFGFCKGTYASGTYAFFTLVFHSCFRHRGLPSNEIILEMATIPSAVNTRGAPSFESEMNAVVSGVDTSAGPLSRRRNKSVEQLATTATCSYPEFPDEIQKLESHYFAIGEVSDVWKCIIKTSGQTVAVKAMRSIQWDLDTRIRFEQRLADLVLQWQELEHPNVIPCLGLTMQLGSNPGLIFPMCSGSIVEYVNTYPNVNKLQLLAQVADGLSYLHHNEVSNIMIADNGTAQIMDAGLFQIVSRAVASYGLCRWMPPEVLNLPNDYYDYDTVESDIDNAATTSYFSPFSKWSNIYSFGMTILEVSTGKAPYHHRIHDATVTFDILCGRSPLRPAEVLVSEGLWGLLQCCWYMTPGNCPMAKEVGLWLNMLWMTESAKALYQL